LRDVENGGLITSFAIVPKANGGKHSFTFFCSAFTPDVMNIIFKVPGFRGLKPGIDVLV
jgi:hypothetical protein